MGKRNYRKPKTSRDDRPPSSLARPSLSLLYNLKNHDIDDDEIPQKGRKTY